MNFLQNKTYLVAGVATVVIISVIVVVLLLVLGQNDNDNNVDVDESVESSSSVDETQGYTVDSEVQEYAEICGDLRLSIQDIFSRSDATYEEIVGELDLALQGYVNVSPPDELIEFHNIVAEQNTALLDLLKQEDQSLSLIHI